VPIKGLFDEELKVPNAVSFVKEDDDTIFLKTLFASRKAKKEFLKSRQISN